MMLWKTKAATTTRADCGALTRYFDARRFDAACCRNFNVENSAYV